MSKFELKTNIKSEIKKVNKAIDHKILRGLPYNNESRYHKILLRRLVAMNRVSFFKRSMKFASMYML